MDPWTIKNKEYVSKNVFTVSTPEWTWFFRKPKPRYEITGKYLFFSADNQKLAKIAIEELQNNRFHEAKINLPNRRIGENDVLCLYYKDDSRRLELAKKYHNSNFPDVFYRYWKSDADTIALKYSKQFKNNLKGWKNPSLKNSS